MKNIVLLFIFIILSFHINAQLTLQDSLIAYYPFNGNANDESQNQNDGVVNGPTLTFDRFGNSNSAYHFSGFEDIRISTPFGGQNPFGQQISVSGWLKTATTKTAATVIAMHTGCYNSTYDDLFIAYINNDNGFHHFQTRAYYHQPIIQTDQIYLTNNQWHHFVYIMSGPKVKLYLDGVAVDSTDNAVPKNYIHSASNDLVIGNLTSNSCPYDLYFVGDIDDIRIYNRALTENDVQLLYQETGTTNIQEEVANITDVKVFPNPASNYFNLELGVEGIQDIRIMYFDMSGKVIGDFYFQNVNQRFNTTIEIDALSNGMYILKIYGIKNGQVLEELNEKLIIQR
jgi:hypothetical protein